MVQDILNQLDRPAVPEPSKPVGMADRMQPIQQEIDHHTVVGLHGMGGIGKTSLANALFNQLRSRFGSRCCHAVVGKDAQSTDALAEIQNQVLDQLCKQPSRSYNLDQNRCWLQQCLADIQVLLVLDNVWTETQLEALLVPVQPGSTVIVTSRSRELLQQHVPRLSSTNSWTCLSVDELTPAQGLELFCQHAFNSSQAPQGREAQAAEAADRCRGLPLSLEVVGRFLANKREEHWPAALDRLRKALPLGSSNSDDRLWSALRLSCDDVDKETQTMLMDIACVLRGQEVQPAVCAWGDSAAICLENAINLSLVKAKPSYSFESSMVFDMHDQIRDMLRAMASEQDSRYHRRYVWEDDLQVGTSPCMHPCDCLQNAFKISLSQHLYGDVPCCPVNVKLNGRMSSPKPGYSAGLMVTSICPAQGHHQPVTIRRFVTRLLV